MQRDLAVAIQRSDHPMMSTLRVVAYLDDIPRAGALAVVELFGCASAFAMDPQTTPLRSGRGRFVHSLHLHASAVLFATLRRERRRS